MRVLFVALAIVMFSCKNKNASVDANTEKPDTTVFFQVRSYFEKQVAEVNKTPFFIYKIGNVNGKTDSSTLSTAEFTRLAKQFYQPDINDPPLKKFYRENIFHDATTNSYTLSYSTANKELPVQSIDVLLKDDAESVKRIFMRRFYDYGDSTAIEQLSWKHNERFEINRMVQPKNGQETSRQVIIVWNNKQ